jgi:hypothetical protein
MQRKCPFKTCRHTLLACEATAVYSSHRGGAKKGVTSKCDAYDIKYSSKSLVVPRPWNLRENPEPPGFGPDPRITRKNPRTSGLWWQPVLTMNTDKN